jgi:hypothetical protein
MGTGGGVTRPVQGSDWMRDINENFSALDTSPNQNYFVDTIDGDLGGDGLSWDTAFKTMAQALSAVGTLGKIFVVGDIREHAVGSNLKFDVSIIGCGSLHHADSPSEGADVGACIWRAPASPTALTPLLELRGRGWKFINIMFDAPTDAAAVLLKRNALEGTAEYDASHASFIGCRFVDGKYGIEDSGGCYNVTIESCQFKGFTTAAIANTSTAVANPLNWHIQNCEFPSDNGAAFGNVVHIESPFSQAVIKNNVFGKVVSTGKYIDLTGGVAGNVVAYNVFGGVYDTDDYVGISGDMWLQNAVAVKATTAPDGLTLVIPAAP